MGAGDVTCWRRRSCSSWSGRPRHDRRGEPAVPQRRCRGGGCMSSSHHPSPGRAPGSPAFDGGPAHPPPAGASGPACAAAAPCGALPAPQARRVADRAAAARRAGTDRSGAALRHRVRRHREGAGQLGGRRGIGRRYRPDRGRGGRRGGQRRHAAGRGGHGGDRRPGGPSAGRGVGPRHTHLAPHGHRSTSPSASRWRTVQTGQGLALVDRFGIVYPGHAPAGAAALHVRSRRTGRRVHRVRRSACWPRCPMHYGRSS